MKRFEYVRPDDVAQAVRDAAGDNVCFLAGGTNLVDLMKENVALPERLVDVNRLPLHEISEIEDGGLQLGALVSNADTAFDERVVSRYPLLSSAILAGASPQLRNAATNGGNLNQRTRCYYFMTPRRPATNAPRVPDVRRSAASIAFTQYSAAANIASRRIHRTCALPWLRWMPGFG